MGSNGEGCATIVLLYTYTESVEKKNYDEEMKKEAQTRAIGWWYSKASQAVLSGVLVQFKIFSLQHAHAGVE